MGSRHEAAIARARHVLADLAEPVEKTIWGSPAGKKRLADRLVAMLPAHKTYVEPFAGSAASRRCPGSATRRRSRGSSTRSPPATWIDSTASST